jgi:Domain of unknown function (DUF4145)
MPTSSDEDSRAIQTLHCNDCRRQTRHELLKELSDSGSEPWGEDYATHWTTTDELFECRGCKAVLLRRTHEFSEWEYPDVRYYPPRIARHKPNWFEEIPAELQVVMGEVYNCLDANTTALPLMGLRAALDILIVDQIGDAGTFAEKLKKLEVSGVISSRNRSVLDAALDAGHAAAHRGWSPRVAQVHAVMDIVENLLQSLYLLDKVAEEIKKATPPRKRKSQTQSPPVNLLR